MRGLSALPPWLKGRWKMGDAGLGWSFTIGRALRPSSNCWLITVKKSSSNSNQKESLDLGRNLSVFKRTILQSSVHQVIVRHNLRLWLSATSFYWAYQVTAFNEASAGTSCRPLHIQEANHDLPIFLTNMLPSWFYENFSRHSKNIPSLILRKLFFYLQAPLWLTTIM